MCRQALVQEICQILEDKKGEDIAMFDLRATEYFVDFVVIATAFVDKHALALLEALKVPLKEKGEHLYHIDAEDPNWIVVDLGDVIVHIFTENSRKKFNLEEFLQTMQKKGQGNV